MEGQYLTPPLPFLVPPSLRTRLPASPPPSPPPPPICYAFATSAVAAGTGVGSFPSSGSKRKKRPCGHGCRIPPPPMWLFCHWRCHSGKQRKMELKGGNSVLQLLQAHGNCCFHSILSATTPGPYLQNCCSQSWPSPPPPFSCHSVMSLFETWLMSQGKSKCLLQPLSWGGLVCATTGRLSHRLPFSCPLFSFFPVAGRRVCVRVG